MLFPTPEAAALDLAASTLGPADTVRTRTELDAAGTLAVVLVAKARRLTSGELRDQHLEVVPCRRVDGGWAPAWESWDVDESGHAWIPDAALTGDPESERPGVRVLAQRVDATYRAAIVRWRSEEIEVATPDGLLLFVVWRDDASAIRLAVGDEDWTDDGAGVRHRQRVEFTTPAESARRRADRLAESMARSPHVISFVR